MSSKDLNDLFFEAFFDDTRKQTFRYKPLLDFVHFLHTYIYIFSGCCTLVVQLPSMLWYIIMYILLTVKKKTQHSDSVDSVISSPF